MARVRRSTANAGEQAIVRRRPETVDRMSAHSSIDKALQVLMRLAPAGPSGLPLRTVASDLGLTKSTVHRTLSALRFRHFVSQDRATGKYRLGSELLRLASEQSDAIDLRGLLHAPLVGLSEEIKQVCHLGLRDGQDVVYVDKVEPVLRIRIASTIGSRFPALTTSLGRAILAFTYGSYDQFAAAFKGKLVRRTPNTLATYKEVWRDLVLTRERGYAVDVEENESGVCCVGVPILRDGLAIGAVSATSLVFQTPPDAFPDLARTIRRRIAPHLTPPLGLPVIG